MLTRPPHHTLVTVVATAALLVGTAALVAPAGVAAQAAASAQDQALDGLAGLRNNDTDPATGPLDGFGEFERAALDYRRRSVGLDLGEVQSVRGFRLVDRVPDGVSRLTADDYTLWTSEDNVSYTELTGWSFDEVVDGAGHLVHTFAEFEAQARYLKVNTSYTDTAFTFSLDMATGILAYDTTPPPVDTTPPADDSMQVVDKGLVHDAGADSAFAPAVTQAANGDILVVFKTTGDVQPGGELRLVRSTDGGQTWGESVTLVEPQHFEDGSLHSSRGNLVTLSDGTILLTFNDGVNYSPFNNRDSLLFVARSTDNGHTWSGLNEPVQLPEVVQREHWACCSRILELDDGSLLMPLWGTLELVPDWQTDPMRWRAAVVKSYDGGHTWTDYSTIAYDPNNPARANGAWPDGFNEPSIAQLADGRLVAMLRYEAITPDLSSPDRFRVYVSHSSDRGTTWSPVQVTSLLGAAPSLTTAPCTRDLGGEGTKLVFGYRDRSTIPGTSTLLNAGAVSVSFDDGLTWSGRTLIQAPDGGAPERANASVMDFLPLNGSRLLTLFHYRAADTGTWNLGYNVLEDAQGSDCLTQLEQARQAAKQRPTVLVERTDRDDWPMRLAVGQLTVSPSTLIRDVVPAAAEAVSCAGDDLYVTDADGQRLDADASLAEAGVTHGAVLTVHSADPANPHVSVGHAEQDGFPQTRHLYGWASACDYAFPFDTGARSVGLRLEVPDGQVVTSVSLRDSDDSTRLTADDYTLWVSEDNDTYLPLQVGYGWVDNDTDPATGNLAHLGHTGGFALDYRKRSVGVDLGEPMTITELALHDANQATRLVPSDLSLWVSDTNAGDWQLVEDVEITQQPGSFVISGIDQTARYVKVVQPYTDTAFTFSNPQLPQMLHVTTAGDLPQQLEGWTFAATKDADGRLVHTFSNLMVTEPYLKIHQNFTSGTASFVLNNVREDVNVTYGPRPQELTVTKRPGDKSGGAVLDVGAPGAFDADWASCPEVVKVDGTYKMFYSSVYDHSRGEGGIGLATSPDGVTWKRANGGEPVLSAGPPGAFDDGLVMCPAVVYDDETEQYLMWYTGQPIEPHSSGFGYYRIGLATSPDGIVWTRANGGEPVLDVGPPGSHDEVQAATPTVVKTENGYRMWYAAWAPNPNHTVMVASSTDGVNWERENDGRPVTGLVGSPYAPAVTKWVGGYLMSYLPLGETGLRGATSSDGIHWTPLAGGAPLLTPGDASEFDGAITSHPTLLRDGYALRVYYTGYRREPGGVLGYRLRIGLADACRNRSGLMKPDCAGPPWDVDSGVPNKSD